MASDAAAELLAATDAGDIPRARAALAAGATLEDTLTAGGSNALHNAAFEGQTGMCAWLLEEGAAVGAARPDGATALDIAAAQGHAETVQVLAMAAQASRPEPPPASPAAPSPAPSPEPDSPGAEPTAIPVVDWHRAETDREGFLADVLHALGEVGFMCLANAPGFEAATQAHTIEQARAFFDAPPALQASASIDQ